MWQSVVVFTNEYFSWASLQFGRIVHDYTNDHKGFIVWKDLLEEKLY